MPLPTLAPAQSDERVIAGVCAGIAQTLAVDVTLVRLVFALLALAGGAGIVLYLALWAYSGKAHTWLAAVLAVVSGGLLLSALGLSDRSVAGIALLKKYPCPSSHPIAVSRATVSASSTPSAVNDSLSWRQRSIVDDTIAASSGFFHSSKTKDLSIFSLLSGNFFRWLKLP